MGLRSLGSGVSLGRQSPARPEEVPDVAPGAVAGGEPGDEAQLLQRLMKTNKRKRKPLPLLTAGAAPRECWFTGAQPEHPRQRQPGLRL